jgi:hypothetical protein
MFLPVLVALLVGVRAQAMTHEEAHDLYEHCKIVSDVAARAAARLDEGKTVSQTVDVLAYDPLDKKERAYLTPIVRQVDRMLRTKLVAPNQVEGKVFARCLDGKV